MTFSTVIKCLPETSSTKCYTYKDFMLPVTYPILLGRNFHYYELSVQYIYMYLQWKYCPHRDDMIGYYLCLFYTSLLEKFECLNPDAIF